MYLLENAHRDYAWGSATQIQQFLDLPVDGHPLAEVWIGANPDLPSTAISAGRAESLNDLITRAPKQTLGCAVYQNFGPQLPFLMKLLAADRGLSLQVHPDRTQALLGFTSEENEGIPLNSPTRNYKDRSHKPEIIYPLTDFELLSGLREPEQSAKLIESLEVNELGPLVDRLRQGGRLAHKVAFEWLLSQRRESTWVDEVHQSANRQRGSRPEMRAVAQLAREYPGDPGVIAPLILNYERLAPGQVVFTGAGTLHAYLRGMAVEVMSSSDNVLRAALTQKHIDKQAVLAITDFVPRLTDYLTPEIDSDSTVNYLVANVPDFGLQVATVRAGTRHKLVASGPRIALCIEGTVVLEGHEELTLRTGSSAFVADQDGQVDVSGNGTVLVAFVPVGYSANGNDAGGGK